MARPCFTAAAHLTTTAVFVRAVARLFRSPQQISRWFSRSPVWLIALLCLIATPTFAVTLSDNGDGTVTDPTTRLTWMRCSMGQTWDGSNCTGAASTFTWDQAKALTGTVTFAGQSDWRLPNIRELQTIVVRERYVQKGEQLSINGRQAAAFNSDAFPNTQWAILFWAASTSTGIIDWRWYVSFDDGKAGTKPPNDRYQVRLVRAGQSSALLSEGRPDSDYVDHRDGTITHMPTGLMWKRCAEGQTWTGSTCTGVGSLYTWDQAGAISSSFAGHTDWRWPTVDELLTLVDYTRAYGNWINTTWFPTASNLGAYFWSASTYAPHSTNAWNVRFTVGTGASDYSTKYGDSSTTASYQVLLVRGGQSFDTFPLTVARSGGNGTVGSSLSDINCGSTCTANFTSGTKVILTATTAAGSRFTGWSSACSGATPTCAVIMSAAQSVTANFMDFWTLAALPKNLSFTNQSVGSTSTTQTVTLTNTGDAPLTIASITASGDFAQTNDCGASLAVNANCTVTITFAPTASGNRTGSVTITSNAAGSPHVVSLSGTGVVLTGIVITGANSINGGASSVYSVKATFDNGNTAIVDIPLILTGGAASLNGKTLTGLSVTNDQAVLLNASYTEGGVTKTATLTITIKAIVSVPNVPVHLGQGWNLIGSGGQQPIDVATFFGDITKISTVWKWLADRSQWAFYTPKLDATALQTYADAKTYKVLSTIEGREGFWVNALEAHDIVVPFGSEYAAVDHRASLLTGWNLVAVGEQVTPVRFNNFLTPYTGAVPPEIGSPTTTTVFQVNLTTLWTWDSARSGWLFYAPQLHKDGTLADYIASKGFLDFTASGKTLGSGVGFWVNKP